MNFIKRIFEKIKKIFINKNQVQRENTTLEIQKLLDEVDINEIIWAKRYDTELEKEEIKPGHRNGPFLVVGKCDKGLICFKGTGTEPIDEKHLRLDKRKYNFHKDSYYNLKYLKIITPSTYSHKMSILRSDDIEKLYRTIKLNKIYFEEDKKIDIPYQVGDIINFKRNYLIIDKKDNKLLCVLIDDSITNLNTNISFDKFKNLDYSNIIEFDINDNNIRYITTVNDNIILNVLKREKEFVLNLENQHNTQRGSIIKSNNNYYYVYAMEGQDCLCFQIIKKEKSNYYELKINNKKYYTNFEDIKILKKEIQETISLSTNEEIELIKNYRKKYKQQERLKEFKEEITDLDNTIKINSVVALNEFSDEKFVVKDILGNIACCVSSNERCNLSAYRHYFNIDNLIIVNEEKIK